MGTVSKTLNIVANTTYNLAIDLWAWSIWATEAGITTTYSSLANLLADEKAVRQLMTVHKSVDYLANYPSGADRETLNTIINNDICAKWINLSDYALDTLSANANIKSVMDTADKYGYGEWGLVGKVPAMTSDTVPSGTVFKSTELNSTYAAWKAYADDWTDSSYGWCPSLSDSAPYIGYQFASPIVIKRIRIGAKYSNENVTFTFEGSNDGFVNDVHQLKTNIIPAHGTTYSVTVITDVNIDNDNAYTYYRMKLTNGSLTGQSWGILLQFYAYAPLGNVPIMTANNAPYGTASASSEYSASYAAWKAFDGVNTNASSWQSADHTNAGYVVYEFTNPICPKKVAFEPVCNGASQPYAKNWEVRGSNDGTQWSDPLASGTVAIPYPIGTLTEKQVTCSTYYKYLKFNITGTYAPDGNAGLKVLQFYGRELTPLIPTMTSNTAPKGEATADSVYNTNFYPYYAFVGLNNSGLRWCSARSANIHWIKYEFDEPLQINAIGIGAANYGTPKASAYTVQVSNDNFASNIVTVANDIIIGDDDYVYNYRTFNDTTKYKYMRVISNSATKEMIISGFQAYAFDYSEKEFATGSTRKTIYDHGVAPSGAITGGTKNPDCLTLSAVGTATVTIDKGTRKYMGGKAGLHASGTNRLKCGSGYSNFTASNMPDSNVFDISSISGSVAVGIEQTASGTFDCTEIWIE